MISTWFFRSPPGGEQQGSRFDNCMTMDFAMIDER
jgi:hypothetical protein